MDFPYYTHLTEKSATSKVLTLWVCWWSDLTPLNITTLISVVLTLMNSGSKLPLEIFQPRVIFVVVMDLEPTMGSYLAFINLLHAPFHRLSDL